MSNRKRLAEELEENPYLEKAMAAQLNVLGFVVKNTIQLAEQLDSIPQSMIGGVFDGIEASPKAAAKGVGGIFNLTEDILFGTINAFSSGPPTPSYRQSIIDAKKRKRW